MTTKPNYLALAVRAAMLLAIVPVSYAQDEAPAESTEANTLDTIVVTARKREESLREVPLSITAISSDRIEKLGLESINDIAKVTPGFSFRSAFGREGDRPVIRGQSNIQGEANAAFFIDGIFVNGSISGFGLDNLERVEVIRGPQAALFGRRTFSGAVNFITKRPTNEPEDKVSMTAATDSERELSANISGALVEDLLKFQFNTRYFQYGGQWPNAVTGIKDLGGQRTAGAGGTLYFTPTDSWESTLRMNYSEDEDEHYAIGRIGDPANLAARGIDGSTAVNYINNVLNCQRPTLTGAVTNGFIQAGPTRIPTVNSPVSSTRSRGAVCGDSPYPSVIGANTSRFMQAGFKPGIDRERTRLSWANDFTTEAGWVFTSMSAYNKLESLSVVDQDYSSQSLFAFPFSVNGAFETIDFGVSKDYSQEFRLASPVDNDLRGIVGYYYYSEEPGSGGYLADMTSFRAATATTAAILPTRNPTFGGLEVTNTALFGMLEYDWTDALTTTAELRVAQDRLELSGRSNSTVAPTGTPTATRVSRTFSRRASYDTVLPRFTIKYDLNDVMNVYGLVAKGNKPGGFNAGVESANLTEAARSLLVSQGFSDFEEETANTYELGLKGGFLDNALSLSSAIYLIDWKNQQLTETAAADQINGLQTLTSYTRSIGKSRVTGLELEADWTLSENFNLSSSFAYQKGEIRDYFSQDLADAQACGVVNRATGCGSASGFDLPRVPPIQAAFGARWNDTLANGWGYFASAQFSYEASRFTQIENNIESGDCKDLGIRGGLNFSEQLSATLFVRNATQDDCVEDVLRYIQPDFGIARPIIPGESNSTATVGLNPTLSRTNLRDYAVTPARERQVGITVSYKF